MQATNIIVFTLNNANVERVVERGKKCVRCSVKNCNSFRYVGEVKPSIRYFRFPRPDDPERQMQWKLACGDPNIMRKDPLQLYNSYRICSEHFEPSLALSPKLPRHAVPTLNLFQIARSVDVQTQTDNFEMNHQTKIKQFKDCSTQTAEKVSRLTPRAQKLSRILKAKKQRIERLTSAIRKFENCFKELQSRKQMLEDALPSRNVK